jgi:fermentation-respiration switch protein FrsA (DUF1100 family)
MNALLTAAATLAIGYALIALVLYFYQPGMLYFPGIPGRELVTSPASIGLEYESLTLVTGDDEHLDAWFIPAEPARGTLLFCHGNAGNISHRLDSIRIFHELGLSVLIFDYRGYGQSSGRPGEQGTYRDAEAAWRYLVDRRGIAPQRVILFGRSLGASIAAWLAARVPAAGLILESGFTSVPDVAAQLYPWLPVRWLSRYRYNTREYLADVRSPVLIIHSREDEIIPYSNGEALFDAAREPKQFLELRGGHNDGFLASARKYLRGLREFLDKVLGK